jgi:DNA-binding NtrC family response regulator
MVKVVLDSLNWPAAEKKLCEAALAEAGSIVEAASLLGITRHHLKRKMMAHLIEWPRSQGRDANAAA